MARNTPPEARNLVIYSIYVRAHGANGKFLDVENDLERLKLLGVDYIWFLPIHPIGKLKAKGSMGCPYSISNYREVNPEYGTEAEFVTLTKKAHALGLKVMIDVVYHHTSHDSNLISEHPTWYRQNADGTPQTSVPEWSDIIDLNHPNDELDEYLIGSLKKWVELGVDGFRCDVASAVPVNFWLKARERLAQVNPQLLWLAESVNPDFIRERRAAGLIAHSDSEVFEAFDILYDYDIWFAWKACVAGKHSVERYLELLALQDTQYPRDFCKLRFVENHDQKRIMAAAASRDQALAWTAFQAFNKGPFLIHAGQESEEKRTPSLFEKEPVAWRNYSLSEYFAKLSKLKKHEVQATGNFKILASTPCLQCAWVPNNTGAGSQRMQTILYGIFNVMGSKSGSITVQLPDGKYLDILSDKEFCVKAGAMPTPTNAAIFEAETKPQEKLKFQEHIPEFWTL